MSIYVNDIHFINYFAFSANSRQSKNLIEQISPKQISDLRKICQNIVKGKIKLSHAEIRKLQKYKTFIRKIAYSKVNKSVLLKNLNGLKVLMKIVASNGTHKKGSFGRIGRVESYNEETGYESNSEQNSDSERKNVKSFYKYYYESSSDEGETRNNADDSKRGIENREEDREENEEENEENEEFISN